MTKLKKSPEETGEKQKKDTRFKKGVSGNPNGRPKDSFSLITLLKQELQKCPEGQDKKTYADLIIKRMLKEAIEKGDQAQIRLIWNYIEGMPIQKIAGADGKALIIQFDPRLKDVNPPSSPIKSSDEQGEV